MYVSLDALSFLSDSGEILTKLCDLSTNVYNIVPGGMPLMFVLSILPLSVLCYIVSETFKKPFTAALCGGLVTFGFLFCARTAVASGRKMLRRVRNRSRRSGRPTY